MKKIIGIITVTVCVLALVGCSCSSSDRSKNTTSNATNNTAQGGQSTISNDLKVDYGNSEIFTKRDMDAALDEIDAEFVKWPGGCVLNSESYSSDAECNTQENIKWMNELAAGKGINESFTQCIMFKTNFHSPVNGGGAWEPDKEYTDYQWWLARSDGGEWHLMTYGY